MQYDIDMKSEYRDMFLTVSTYLLSIEGMLETKKNRITTYSIKKAGICHMRTMPYGIDIGFLKGAKMTDTYDVLTGNGKAMRVLQIREIDLKIIEHYVEQAMMIIS